MTMLAMGDDTDQLSDAALIADVSDALIEPRSKGADSFVLHSALELAARVALLPYVSAPRRDDARRRLVELADGFRSYSPPIIAPRQRQFDSVAAGARFLAAAIERGELDDVDSAAQWLGRTATPVELQHLLADAVIARLSAAAHAPIFLYLLPRVAPRGEISGELLRGLVRELAGLPDWNLHWIDRRRPHPVATGDALFASLADTPLLGPSTSDFIYPLMSRVDTDERAGAQLDALTGAGDLADRGRAVTRIAAWSMLDEPEVHAPYGWSHCLTMPQAVLGVAHACADPSRALAVAATYVVGFRASLATRSLRTTFDEPDPRCSLAEALAAGPRAAAAAVWCGTDDRLREVTTELATVASVHRDAHLVKHTLASIDAAAADPSQRRVHLAAAAALAGWWTRHDGDAPAG